MDSVSAPRQGLEQQLVHARVILSKGLLVALALLFAGMSIAGAILFSLKPLMSPEMFTSTLWISLLPATLMVFLVIGSTVFTNRMLTGMREAQATDGLSGLRSALQAWVDREQTVLTRDERAAEATSAHDLQELEVRAQWAVRTLDLISELEADERALEKPDAGAQRDRRSAMHDLRQKVAARREVERTSG